MDYFGVIKKAYEVTVKHKFLWIFGLFAGAGGIGMSRVGPSLNDLSTSSANTVNLPDFRWEYVTVGLILLLVIAIFFALLNYTSQGALVAEFTEAERGNRLTFHDGLEIGFKNFWRIFVLNLIAGVAILLVIIFLIALIALFAVIGAKFIAVFLGITFVFLFLIFLILFALIFPYAIRIIVLEKVGILESIREALHFVRDNLLHVIVMYLLTYAINLGIIIAALLIFGLIALVLFLVGFGLYLGSPIIAIVYGAIVAVVFLIACLVFHSAYSTFNHGVFTLTYLRLRK